MRRSPNAGRWAALVVALGLVGWLLSRPSDGGDGASVLARPGDGSVRVAPGVAPMASPGEPLAAEADAGGAAEAGVATDQPTAPRAVLRVEHADGRPAEGGRVVFEPPAGPLTFAWTGGPIDAALGDLTAGVALAGLSDDLQRVEPVELEDGTWLATLPAGGVVSGTVRVDGAPPRQPIHVALVRSRPRGDTWTALDARWRRALALPRSGLWGDHQAMCQRVAPDGSFHFSGLPDGWRGRLHFPDRYMAERRWGLVSLSEPVEGYRLELTSCPTIQARLWMPDGSPAADARVRSTLLTTFDRLDGPAVLADAEGRVRVPCGWDPGIAALVRFTAADGSAVAARRVTDADRLGSVDLGDVWLEALSGATLRVVDERGAAVAGALAVPPDVDGGWDADRRSASSDEAGLITLDLTASAEEIGVLSFEHSTRSVVPDGGTADEPQQVVLAGCASLELVWAAGDIVPAAWLVSARAPLLEEGEGYEVSEARQAVGASEPARRSVQRDHSVFPARAAGQLRYAAGDGPVRLSCLASGVVFDVELLGAADELLWTRTDVVLPPAGTTRLLADLGALPLQSIEGLVTDTDGRPLADASIFVGPTGVEPERGVRTDAEGRFRIEVALSGPLRVDIARQGFETRVIDPAPSVVRVALQAR